MSVRSAEEAAQPPRDSLTVDDALSYLRKFAGAGVAADAVKVARLREQFLRVQCVVNLSSEAPGQDAPPQEQEQLLKPRSRSNTSGAVAGVY